MTVKILTPQRLGLTLGVMPRRLWVLPAVFLALGLSGAAQRIGGYRFVVPRSSQLACTTTTADASRTAVSNAITNANTGDVICVPAATATWSTPLNITKGITLSGAGIGNTVINSTVSPNFDACDSAIICYDPATPANDSPFRITGFTFDGNGNSGCLALQNTPYASAVIQTKLRIDHNHFTRCYDNSFSVRAIMVDGLSFGVIDNNTFLNNEKTFDDELSDDFGWDVAVDPGGPNSMYFEDNTVTNNITDLSIVTSSGQGGRYVARFNTVDTSSQTDNGQHWDIHGDLSDRGSPIAEIYFNVLTTRAGAYQLVDHRGGIGLIFKNRVIKSASDLVIANREEQGTSYPALDQVTLSYYWLNTYGTTTGLENNFPTVDEIEDSCTPQCVLENRDWWEWKTSFNGTVGIGSGVRSARPSTCTTGVAYWSTDQGEWNSTNGATADGTLDRCTSTNNWTNAYYTPYTYPHPLRGGS